MHHHRLIKNAGVCPPPPLYTPPVSVLITEQVTVLIAMGKHIKQILTNKKYYLKLSHYVAPPFIFMTNIKPSL